MEYDVIIIGGGLAGLTAGALLAQSGYKICVCEKSAKLGGRAAVTERNQCLVDYGLHAVRFGKEGKVADVFKKLDIKLDFIELEKPVVYANNRFYNLPKGVSGILTARFLSIKSRLKLLSLFKNVLKVKPSDFMNITVDEWLSDKKISSDLYRLFCVYSAAGIVCTDLKKASAGELFSFIKKAVRARQAVAYPKGGWQYIINNLVKKIESKGTILTNTKISNLIFDANIVKCVKYGDNILSARAFICALPVQELQSIVNIEKISRQYINYVKNIEPTSGICLDFSLRKKISNIKSLIFTLKPVTMGCFTSNIEPNVAPHNRLLGAWFYPVDYKLIKTKTVIDKKITELKKILSQMFPNIWSYLDWERTMVLDIVDGAMPKVGQTTKDRIDIRTQIPNLFLAGDTTAGDGWGGDIAFDSAVKCASAITGYLKTSS